MNVQNKKVILIGAGYWGTNIAKNLSRGMPLRYTSSNRIASLIGNGIYTYSYFYKVLNFRYFHQQE